MLIDINAKGLTFLSCHPSAGWDLLTIQALLNEKGDPSWSLPQRKVGLG